MGGPMSLAMSLEAHAGRARPANGGAGAVETEEGITLLSRPAAADVFIDDFVRADSANGELGDDWTVVDGGTEDDPFRILDNNLHAAFPGSTTEHRSAYISKAGWESVEEGFIAVIIPDVTGADGDPTIGPVWYWNGGNIDTDDDMTAYVLRRTRAGRDTFLQEISPGPTFTSIDTDFNLGDSTGQHLLQASFEPAIQTCAVSVYTSGPDYSDGHTQNGTDASLSAGKLGVFIRITSGTTGSPVAGIGHVLAVKGEGSRFITVTGLPSGWKARVKDRVWGYAVESGGTALIPCSSSFIDDETGYDAIEIVNGSDELQATFNKATASDGKILPGTVFSYAA